MNKVILFGATGKLGTQIAIKLREKNYDVTAVVRNDSKADQFKQYVNHIIIADVTDANSLKDICKGFEIVISSLGKSVSLKDRSKPGFKDIDLNANTAILHEAKAASVKKFIYISAHGAERNLHLTYFKTHHYFSQYVKRSGIEFSIIKPPAIMSSFIDLIEMAKKGRMITIGKGDKLTNPIYEGDLAQICVESISAKNAKNAEIEAGGKTLYSRRQINDIIQHHVDASKKIRTIPLWLVKFGIPFIKLLDKNTYDKFAFFLEVIRHDTVAPKLGQTTLEAYLGNKLYLN